MDYELITRLVVDFQQRNMPDLTARDAELNFVRDMSLAVVGGRRCGKTYRTYQFIRDYLAGGGGMENICRIQFNDHRLSGMKGRDLSVIEEAYYALYPDKRGRETVYFIFDEIQRVDGWEDYILQLIDDPYRRVLITGSTSRLLKGEIASALRGKNFSVVLYPFSFNEFIRHYGIDPDAVSGGGRAHLRKYLQRYLDQGGFPGLLDLDDHLHHELLQNYWDVMVLRDVIEAHPHDNINITVFTAFALALVSRIGCPVTVRKLIRNMKEDGLSFSSNTIYTYLGHLEEAFMLYTIPIFSRSERIRNRNYRKVYSVDWALANAVGQGGGIDAARRLENMVFLELRRRGMDVYYYLTRSGHEIDLLALEGGDRGGRPRIFQVCYDFSAPEVRRRELRGIPETASHFGLKDAVIVTFNDEEQLTESGIRIRVVPAWKWLLEK